MGLTDRLAERLVASDVALERAVLEEAARHVLRDEAPLAPESVAMAAVDSLLGMGPVEELLRDPEVSDVLVNAPDAIFVERRGELERSEVSFPSGAAIVAAVERVITPLGLRLDTASPAVAARLPDGSRLHAMIPPVAIDGPTVAIRRFTQAVPDLDTMVDAGAIPAGHAARLRATVADERGNVVVAGGTGSGKTTLLNVLSRCIPSSERVVTIEDAAELQLEGHVVRLEARPPNAEGAGEVTLQELVRHALRLRPDRIVVGEVRGPEALDMVQAMSTGHDGSLSTLHASSSHEALLRLEILAAGAGMRVEPDTLRRQIQAALDVVVVMQRRRGRRMVVEVADVTDDGSVRKW